MRDLVLFSHMIIGSLLILLSIWILLELKRKSLFLKQLSVVTAALSWLILIPAGKLYLTFYPATKTVIKAGSKPWLHSIFMETKEHWGLLLPIIATVAAGLVLMEKDKESRKWWILLIVLSFLIGMAGRLITSGGFS